MQWWCGITDGRIARTLVSTSQEKDMADELTPKQAHFARCLGSGMSQAAAYREAYNCKADSLSKTQQEAASRLMRDSKVRARVQQVIRAREQAVINAAITDRELVLRKLRHMMDHADPTDGPKIRATELLGRTAGMFKDVVETQVHRTAEEIEEELMLRLQSIGTGQDSVVDSTSEDDVVGGTDEDDQGTDDMSGTSVH